MKRLDQVLFQSLEQKEIVRTAKAWQALRRWPEVVGESLAQKSWPDRYERGTVYVAVTGSAWAQELRMQRELILERLGSMLRDRGLFAEVRFGVRELPDRDAVGPSAAAKPKDDRSQLSFQELKERILSRSQNEE